MSLISRFIFLIVIALVSSNANGTEFQIKGRTLGMDEKSACGENKIESHQARLDATGVKGLAFPVTSCDVILDTVAGIKPKEPARLLFWNGRLIRMIVRFENLDFDDSVALSIAFLNLFGNPKTVQSPIRTDTWASGKNKLELEWTSRFPSNVGVYLTDIDGWHEYEQALENAKNSIRALDENERINDLRN